MTFVYNNIQSTNMDFSVLVLYNLYSICRIFKMKPMSITAKLEEKSYRTTIKCENNAGRVSYYTYYLCLPAYEYVIRSIEEDFNIKAVLEP